MSTVRLTDIERLREALRPFARAYKALSEGRGSDLSGWETVRVEHLRAAWLALGDT